MYTYIRQRVITHTHNDGQIKSASVKVAHSTESRSFSHAFGTSVQTIRDAAYHTVHISTKKRLKYEKEQMNRLTVPTTYS